MPVCIRTYVLLAGLHIALDRRGALLRKGKLFPAKLTLAFTTETQSEGNQIFLLVDVILGGSYGYFSEDHICLFHIPCAYKSGGVLPQLVCNHSVPGFRVIFPSASTKWHV